MDILVLLILAPSCSRLLSLALSWCGAIAARPRKWHWFDRGRGLKVVMGGGIIVLPGLHDLLRVNMKNDDHYRGWRRWPDHQGQFTSLTPLRSSSFAWPPRSTPSPVRHSRWGRIPMIWVLIRSLLEGKVQDTMRAITAGMDLIELHQSRASFVQKVQQTLNNDLSPNGLELESVALTKLDETPISKLDENNTFDVTGMRVRSAIVSEQKKQRVVIEEDAALEIARTQQSNRIQKLEVERIEAEATQAQRIAVAELRPARPANNPVLPKKPKGCAKSRGSSASAACARRRSNRT